MGGAVSKLELRNMTVSIPAPVESLTQVVASHGTASFSKRDGALTWHVPIIDATAASGTVEFALSGMPSADALFPIHCAFTGAATLCEVDVAEVRLIAAGLSIEDWMIDGRPVY